MRTLYTEETRRLSDAIIPYRAVDVINVYIKPHVPKK